jgi:hypothetical protein
MGFAASAISSPAVGQTGPVPVGLIASGDRIALSIIVAVALLKLADLWISNLKALGDIKSDIASLEMSDEKDRLEIGRE